MQIAAPNLSPPPAPPPINFPEAFVGLWERHRYKVMYGGRGGAKSWTVARYLILIAFTNRDERIACFRELQSSIKDSVHQLLVDQIEDLGLTPWFGIERDTIWCKITESYFLFKGLRHNYTEIKSTEGITRCWVEEAQLVSKESWQILIPTIRQPGSEIIITFNPLEEDHETYQRFVVNRPPDCWVRKINWNDNPYFPEVLELERQYMLKVDPEGYAHVWEGEPLTLSDAVIFRGKYVADIFELPEYGTQLFHGADFGFAEDPATLMGPMWVTGDAPNDHLWVYNERFGFGVEIDHLPAMYDEIPTSRTWPIKADCARPETISYLRRQGFNIKAAEKWAGVVDDRIAHLKGFAMIHIHATNCPNLLREARLYKYKVDKITDEVLPIVVDKHNHGWDGVGYGLDGYIHKRGMNKVWGKLGGRR